MLAVGDRVERIHDDNGGKVPVGSIGTVTSFTLEDHVIVDWDDPPRSGNSINLRQNLRLLDCSPVGMCMGDDMPESKPLLPCAPIARKAIPLASGVLDYFPAALAEVAKVSKIGSDQHHPGQPLHWERGKSMDQADTLMRHLLERGTLDTDGQRHSAKVAWRALALLQIELEAEGAPVSRGSK